MKVLVIISSNDPETAWNAYRLANTCLAYDDETTIILLGKGVETASIHSIKYNVREQSEIFEEAGGKVIGCGVCVESRQDTMPLLSEDIKGEMGSMQTLYGLTKDSDKVMTF